MASATPLEASARSFGGALGADEGGPGGERQAEEEREGDRPAVEQTLDVGELCERHDRDLSLVFYPLGEQGVSDLDGA